LASALLYRTSRRALMTLEILTNLEDKLWQFGLNPIEWQLQFSDTTTTQQSNNIVAMKRIRIVNLEDHDFYFEAEAILETRKQQVKARWENLELIAI
jgi:hypothetical protein